MTFGTKKAKKAIESLSQNAISPRVPRNLSPNSARKTVKNNPNATAVLESMAESAKNAPILEEMQAVADESKPRPPCNLQGKTPAEVYDLVDIVGMEVLNDIKVKSWMESIEKSLRRKKKKHQTGVEGQEVVTRSLFALHRSAEIVNDHDIKKAKTLKYYMLLFEYFIRLKPVGGGIKRLPRESSLKDDLGVDKSVVDVLNERFSRNG